MTIKFEGFEMRDFTWWETRNEAYKKPLKERLYRLGKAIDLYLTQHGSTLALKEMGLIQKYDDHAWVTFSSLPDRVYRKRPHVTLDINSTGLVLHLNLELVDNARYFARMVQDNPREVISIVRPMGEALELQVWLRRNLHGQSWEPEQPAFFSINELTEGSLGGLVEETRAKETATLRAAFFISQYIATTDAINAGPALVDQLGATILEKFPDALRFFDWERVPPQGRKPRATPALPALPFEPMTETTELTVVIGRSLDNVWLELQGRARSLADNGSPLFFSAESPPVSVQTVGQDVILLCTRHSLTKLPVLYRDVAELWTSIARRGLAAPVDTQRIAAITMSRLLQGLEWSEQAGQLLMRDRARAMKPYQGQRPPRFVNGKGGTGEGQIHRNLKDSIARDPVATLGERLVLVGKEFVFQSDDRLDLLFQDMDGRYVCVEVEPHVGSSDLVPYLQAVKYRALTAVTFGVALADVRSIVAAPKIEYGPAMIGTRYGIETYTLIGL